MSSTPHDPIADLQSDLDSGKVKLEFDDRLGYLTSVLQLLDIDTSSQVLVFSKTSFQRTKISPRRPRALYFNDRVYVGWVQQGDVLEVSSVDPDLGAVFYTLDQRSTDRPKFERQTHNCLTCHGSSHTSHVPGHFVRSVFPDRGGNPVLSAGTFRTDYTSPLDERWGGWYVSGTHGEQRHMGNVTLTSRSASETLERETGANVTDLSELALLDTTAYLSPHSDIVALLVLEHQVAMHNALTAANHRGRLAQRDAAIMNEALGRGDDHESESTQRRFESAATLVVDHLLLVDEIALTDPIAGTTSFAQDFQQRGPHDAQGRSLRQLDLKGRLFAYPCSYLIYTPAFDRLPTPVLQRVFRQLWNVLTEQSSAERYRHLSPEDRTAIRKILMATKDGLPAYWTAPTESAN